MSVNYTITLSDAENKARWASIEDEEDDIHHYDFGNVVRKHNANKELIDSKEIDDYEISMNTTTCYANESTLNTMFNMSQSM
jgi:hypothetical protein